MVDCLTNILQNDRLNAYPLFQKFCVLKEKGLRKEALKALFSFIDEVNQWNNEERRNFSCWLFTIFESSEDNHHVLVHPLEENLLKPILEKWMKQNPEEVRVYRWYGLFLQTEKRLEYLNYAIKLGGKSEQLSILKLIDIHFYSLWYSFHHIYENLYLGNIEQDFIRITELQQLNNRLECHETSEKNHREINYYKELLNDWILFSQEQKKDFVKWCKRKEKDYHWIKAYYYEP